MGALQPAFTDPVHQAQQVFRQILDAMARPGSIRELANLPLAAPGLSPAATAVCLTLADFETPLWLDEKASKAREYLVFHRNCPITAEPRQATFAVIGNAEKLPGFEAFQNGSDEYPEASATLIIEANQLSNGTGKTLTGPGIKDSTRLEVDGVDDNFWEQVKANHTLFPRGVDLIFTCGEQIAALPRSTQVAEV